MNLVSQLSSVFIKSLSCWLYCSSIIIRSFMAALVLLIHNAIQRLQSVGLGKPRGNAPSVINSIPPRRSARAGRPQENKRGQESQKTKPRRVGSAHHEALTSAQPGGRSPPYKLRGQASSVLFFLVPSTQTVGQHKALPLLAATSACNALLMQAYLNYRSKVMSSRTNVSVKKGT